MTEGGNPLQDAVNDDAQSFVTKSVQHEVLEQRWTLSFVAEEVEEEYVVFAHNSFVTLTVFIIGHAIGLSAGPITRPYGWHLSITIIICIVCALIILAVLCYFLCVRPPPPKEFAEALKRANYIELLAFIYCLLACVYAAVPYLASRNCEDHYSSQSKNEEEINDECFVVIYPFIYAFGTLSQFHTILRSRFLIPITFLWQCIQFAMRPVAPHDTTRVLVSKIIVHFSFAFMLSAVQIMLEVKRRNSFIAFVRMKRSAELVHDLSRGLHAALDACLPSTVVERLNAGRPVVDYAEKCTYGACMIHDFAQWTTKLLVGDAVLSVSLLYASFDRLCASHRAEKIKILGDQYEFAIGLRGKCSETDIDQMLRIATLMHKHAKLLNRFGIEIVPLLQIGIHVGPAFGAIIGSHSLMYDSFGRTPSAARSAARQCPPGSTAVSQAALELCKLVKDEDVTALASQVYVDNVGEFFLVKFGASTAVAKAVLPGGTDSAELKLEANATFGSLNETTKAYLHSLILKANPDRVNTFSEHIFGHELLCEAQKRLNDCDTSWISPQGHFHHTRIQEDFYQFLWQGERFEGVTAMTALGLIFLIQFIVLFIEDSQNAILPSIALCVVACSFVVNGILRKFWYISRWFQGASQLLFLFYFAALGSLTRCLINRDVLYTTFLFSFAPFRAATRLPFILTFVLFVAMFLAPQAVVTYALLDGGIWGTPVFVIVNLAVLSVALASDHSRKAGDVVEFRNWYSTKVALQAATDEKIILQALLELAVPKELAPIVLQRKEDATSYIKFRNDIVVVQIRHDLLLQHVAASSVDGNSIEAIHRIEKEHEIVETIVRQQALLHVVTVSGDTTLIAGPFGELDRTVPQPEDEEDLRSSRVAMRGAQAHIESIVIAAIEGLRVFGELQRRFGKTITSLGGIGSAIEGFFGYQGITFGLMGPVVRETNALTEAAPPSFYGVSSAFLRMIHNGNTPYDHLVRFLAPTQWRVRGVGSVTIHPIQTLEATQVT